MLLLPLPFGPMITVTPGSKVSSVGLAKVLKPRSRTECRWVTSRLPAISEEGESLPGRRLLAHLDRGPRAPAPDVLLDRHFGREYPRVRRAGFGDQTVDRLQTTGSEQLLQCGLVIDVSGDRIADLFFKGLHHRDARLLEPVGQIHGADQCLEHVPLHR